MQYLNMRKALGLITALAFFAGGMQTALAVGTASGTTISNTATVDYQVNTSARQATGAAPDITVDNRVDLTVTNTDTANNVNVTPGSTNQILTFTVTNTGNTTQGYLLTLAFGTTAIPMSNYEIYVDANNDGVPDAGELYTTGNNAGDLDPNGGTDTMTVLVVADTPAGAVDGNQDDVRLVAQTTNAGTTTVTLASASPDPDPSVLDVVFADGTGSASDADRDGQHSAAATYTVSSAALTVTKSISNVNDEFNGDGGFSIPGAVVRYEVTVDNTGTTATDADSVVISDQIPANTKICVSATGRCTASDTPALNFAASGLATVTRQYSNDGGTTWTYSPTADSQGADANVTHVRYISTGAMSAGGSMTLTFGVVIE